MLLRLGSGLVLVLLVACSSSTPSNTSSSSSSSSSGSSGDDDDEVDLDKLVTATECKDRCAKRVGKDGCGESQTDANKNCNSICRERATGHQMVCLEKELECDDLTHERTIVELCPAS